MRDQMEGLVKRCALVVLLFLLVGCGDDNTPTNVPGTPYGLWSANHVQLSISNSGAWTAQVAQRNCDGGRLFPAFTVSGFLQALDGTIIHFLDGSTACNGGVYRRLDVTFNSSAGTLSINGAEIRSCVSCGAPIGGNATRVQ